MRRTVTRSPTANAHGDRHAGGRLRAVEEGGHDCHQLGARPSDRVGSARWTGAGVDLVDRERPSSTSAASTAAAQRS